MTKSSVSLRAVERDETQTNGFLIQARVRNHVRASVVGNIALFCFAICGIALAVARVLVLGSEFARAEGATADTAIGECRVGTSVTPGGVFAYEVLIHHNFNNVGNEGENVALSAVTPPVGPGPVSFGIDCNQESAYQSR